MEFRKNNIIDFYDNRRIACGLILEVEDRRLRILTDQGKETNIPLSRALTSDHDPFFPLRESRDAQVQKLKEIWARREEIKTNIDLAELWEIVVTETDEIDLSELTALFFGEKQDMNQAASLIRAINEDRLYFKVKPDRIEVPRPDVVEHALLQRERERERGEFIARAADFLVDLTSRDGAGDRAMPEGLAPMLEEAVKAGPEWIGVKPVKEIFSRAGLAPRWDPFRVLVKLGLWSEDENITLRTENVPVEFSPEVLAAAQETARKALPEGGEDLSHEEPITIDATYTRDVDDALSLSFDGDDALVGIHITDVCHFVDGNDLLHEELRERATSIYLPEIMIPMIPPVLSEEAASLIVGELRPAVSVLVRVGPDLLIKGHRITQSLIRVKERLSYEDADARIASGGSKEVSLYRIACSLRAQRIAAGALIFKDPELSVRVVEDQGIEVKVRPRENPAQILVSEMMILANSLFARFLSDRAIPGVFRSQPPPLEKVELGENYDPVLSYRAKRALSRGDIGIEPAPHSTLGLGLYATATSPLRRYTDLLVQAQVKAALQGRTPPRERNDLERLVSEISYRLDRASMMERERQRYFLLKYLERKRDEEFEAVVLHRFPRFHLVQMTSLCINAALSTPNSLSLNPYDRALVRIDKINPRDDKLGLALVRLL
jgi:exoribonuclease II